MPTQSLIRRVLAFTTLAILVALPSTVLAGEARVGSANLHSTPFASATYGPGIVSGRATLVGNAGNGTTSVVVRVEGLRPGTVHIAHIHLGTCTALKPGLIIADLGPLVANAHGIAVGRTAIDVSTVGIADCEWWVAVHEGPANASPQTPAIAVGPVRFLDNRP
ncbi:MAG: hypothetical protein NVS9B8_18120 [Candidatus Limnocylindrales bacterium]